MVHENEVRVAHTNCDVTTHDVSDGINGHDDEVGVSLAIIINSIIFL